MERRDYFRDRFSDTELREILAAANLAPRDILSKRARVYQARRDEIDAMDDDALIAAMVEEPTLLRRPLVITDKGHVVGYNRTELERLLDSEGNA